MLDHDRKSQGADHNYEESEREESAGFQLSKGWYCVVRCGAMRMRGGTSYCFSGSLVRNMIGIGYIIKIRSVTMLLMPGVGVLVSATVSWWRGGEIITNSVYLAQCDSARSCITRRLVSREFVGYCLEILYYGGRNYLMEPDKPALGASQH